MVKRREFLSLLPTGAAICLAAKAAAASDGRLTTEQIQAYYAYLWTEMTAVEKKLGISRFDHETLELGRAAAAELRSSTTLEQRIAAITALKRPRTFRVLFRPQ